MSGYLQSGHTVFTWMEYIADAFSRQTECIEWKILI